MIRVRGDLAPTLSTDEAAELLGTTADTLRDLLHRGEVPLQPIRLGRVLRWPTAELLRVLGLDVEMTAT